MAITNFLILGNDGQGNIQRVGLADSGIKDSFGNVIWQLATEAGPGATMPGIDATHPAYVTPVTQTALVASGAAAANGDNTIITGTALKKIVITSVVLQNESTTATTMILKDGAGGAALLRVLGQNQGDGVAMVFPTDVRRKLTTGGNLVLNLSGANSCGYTIGYYLE